mmetsp:Transcript_31763/g.77757  ORF Transcript_31763/g.77757 Transcript_31763/m.77757 type:complete len:226 (+) Transcript_31763:140-817(+)
MAVKGRVSFEVLPDDSVLEVMKRLPVRDAVSLGQTCRRWHILVNSCEELWRVFTLRDFGVRCGGKAVYKYILTHTFVASLTAEEIRLRGFTSVQTKPRGVRQSTKDNAKTWRFSCPGKREDCVELEFALESVPKKGLAVRLEKTKTSCDCRHSWPSSYLCSMSLAINDSVVRVINLRSRTKDANLGQVAIYPNALTEGHNKLTLRHALNSSCACSLKEVVITPLL